MSAHTIEERIQLMHKYAKQLCGEVASGAITSETLGRSLTVQWAVVKALELVGEQAWQLNKLGYELGEGIDLNAVAGMRHRLVHHYEGVDWNIVEIVLFKEMPKLVSQLEIAMDKRDIEPIA